MVTLNHNNDIKDFLTNDEIEYGHLFPYRNSVPRISTHIFSDIKNSNKTLDKYIISMMMDPDYIGWTSKVILNIDLFPIQIAILRNLWKTTFPMLIACRGGSKTYLLAVYALLRAIFDQGSKVVIVGAGLRQAKLVFNYIETIWNNSPILRKIVGGGKKSGPRQNVDLCYFNIGASKIVAIPLGDGTKVRGFRANIIIADEFASVPENIFDIVVRGFASTTKSPVEESKKKYLEKKLKELKIPTKITKDLANKKVKGNQIVYSGTAYYEFNHFAKKFRMWEEIIKNKNDTDKLAEIFGGPNMIPEDFDPKDYCIIRVPYNYLPDGLLDTKQLAHAKALLPRNIYLMEYCAIFVKDSDGFFPRSLIESCTCVPGKPIFTPDGEVSFTPLMFGERGHKYGMGIDPAAERDNLAVTIVEIFPNHSRVVYCWSVNKGVFNKRKKLGLIKENDYYEYCCSKIKEIYRLFKPIRIEMDSQGGGYPISEMLRNKKLIDKEKGDCPIYEIIDPEDPKETDLEKDGPHILHLVKQDNEFNMQANICMHKNFETKRLLFPAFDTVKMQAALVAEKSLQIQHDTFEENVNNIEELKNELCTIQMSETTTGKERFDTPQVKQPGTLEGRTVKGKLKKDRYTSLLLIHKFIYDTTTEHKTSVNYEDVVGNINKLKNIDPNEKLYQGLGLAGVQMDLPDQRYYGGIQNGEIFK